MILVTGAGGKTGRAVVRALARRGAVVRVFVRRPEQAPPLRQLGAQDVVVGDLASRDDVTRAVHGAGAAYHICPNVHPDEVAIGQLVINASRHDGVAQFGFHSVLHPATDAMPHHARKAAVEELLVASALPHVVLQPASYMQNVLAGWDRIVREGIYAVPYALTTRLGMVDLEDVAEVAARVLTEPGHLGRIYDLAGSEVLDQNEIAAILSRTLGRLVQARTVPRDEWERRARATGAGEYQVATLLAMFDYYERHGFWGNPHTLGALLGREPTTFAAFVERAARDTRA